MIRHRPLKPVSTRSCSKGFQVIARCCLTGLGLTGLDISCIGQNSFLAIIYQWYHNSQESSLYTDSHFYSYGRVVISSNLCHPPILSLYEHMIAFGLFIALPSPFTLSCITNIQDRLSCEGKMFSPQNCSFLLHQEKE